MRFSHFLFLASSLAYLVFALPVTSPEPFVSLSKGKAVTKSPLSIARNPTAEPPLLQRDGLIEQTLSLLQKRSSKGKGPARPPFRPQPSKHQPKVKKQVKKNARVQRATAKKARKMLSPKRGSKTTGCARNVHPRSLFGRATDTPPCEDDHHTLETDVDLKLKKFPPGQPGEEGELSGIIKAGTRNLGALSTNNRGVYKVNNWGGLPGTQIAKEFHDHKQMKTEAENLKKVGHLLAESDAQSKRHWVVMKHVPGSRLTETEQYKKAISPSTSKKDCEKFLTDRHKEFANKVVDFETEHKMLHGDLKNDNVHWEFDHAGQTTVHLLDFGNMRHSAKAKETHMKYNGGGKTTEAYATHRARLEWNLSRCQGN